MDPSEVARQKRQMAQLLRMPPERAAAIVVAGLAADLPEGVDRARAAIDSGRAAQALDLLVRVSNS